MFLFIENNANSAQLRRVGAKLGNMSIFCISAYRFAFALKQFQYFLLGKSS